MSADDLENFEAELELSMYKEYRDVIGLFRYFVETDRRSYLANTVDVSTQIHGDGVLHEVTLRDAWVWDAYRASRFVTNVRVLTSEDINIEELAKPDLGTSEEEPFSRR